MNLVPQDQHDEVHFTKIISDVHEKERLVMFTINEVKILERFIESGFVGGLIEERVHKLEDHLQKIRLPLLDLADYEDRLGKIEGHLQKTKPVPEPFTHSEFEEAVPEESREALAWKSFSPEKHAKPLTQEPREPFSYEVIDKRQGKTILKRLSALESQVSTICTLLSNIGEIK